MKSITNKIEVIREVLDNIEEGLSKVLSSDELDKLNLTEQKMVQIEDMLSETYDLLCEQVDTLEDIDYLINTRYKQLIS